MAGQRYTKTITIVDTSNVALTLYEYADLFVIAGTETLTQDWSLSFTGTPKNGFRLEIEYDAVITLNTHHVYILGTQLPDEYAAKKVNITATYNSGWNVKFNPSMDETSIVVQGNIVDEAVNTNKLADTTAGYVLVGSVAGRPVFVEVTGDITVSSTGVTSIGNLKITNAMFSDQVANALSIAKIIGSTKSRVLVSNAATGILNEDATTITELQRLNGVTPGTSTAMKALVLGAGKTIDEVDISSVLKLAGTPVTAEADELNRLDGITASTAELNLLAGLTSVHADLELVSGAAAAGVTAADVQALVNLAATLSFTASGIKMAAGKSIEVDTASQTASSRIINADDAIEAYDDVIIADIPLASSLDLTLPSVAALTKQAIRILVRKNPGNQNLTITADGADSIWVGGADAALATIVNPSVDTLITVTNYAAGNWIVTK